MVQIPESYKNTETQPISRKDLHLSWLNAYKEREALLNKLTKDYNEQGIIPEDESEEILRLKELDDELLHDEDLKSRRLFAYYKPPVKITSIHDDYKRRAYNI
jgi:hypothetical protein